MTKAGETIEIGRFTFEPNARELRAEGGETVALRPQTAAVLAMLAAHRGDVVSKDALMETVWADTFVTDDSLVQCISEIRKALGPEGRDLLRTVPKAGYRLMPLEGAPEVEEAVTTRWRGIALTIGVMVAVLVLALVELLPRFRPEDEARTAPTVAVLPFTNMSDTADDIYFSNGVAEDLIVALSQLPDIRVISRGAAFSFDLTGADIREVATLLNADVVLEGSVRRVQDQLRVSAALVDGETGANLWAERYEGSREDIFAFQEAVLTALAETLSVRLSPAERARQGIIGTRSVAAHDAYLRARELENLYTRETNIEAEAALREAIREDPEFALAHALLSQIMSFRVENRWTNDTDRTVKAAFAAAERAVALDDGLPLAHFALARLYTRSFAPDVEKAIAGFRRAIEIDPDYDDAYAFLANTYIFDGRADDALPLIEAAFERNPVPPFWYFLARGMAQYFLGNYEAAEVALVEARDRNPTAPYPYRFLIATYGRMGEADEADWMAMEYEALGRSATIAALMDSASIHDPGYRAAFAEGFRMAGLPEE